MRNQKHSHVTSSCGRTALCLIPALLAAAVPAAASGRLPVPPASFLNYHAATVRALSSEVTVDPAVRARLARHFHITEAQMTTYIRRNLVLTRLKRTQTYRVACVRRNGSEYYLQERLAAGTPIFASRVTGQPILKLACGNPMVSALPPGPVAVLPPAPPRIATGPAVLGGATPAPLPTLASLNASQDLPISSTDTPALPTVAVADFPPTILTGRGAGNILPALLGLGGAVAVFGHGGSGSAAAPAAVPEASTTVSLGLLLMAGSVVLVLRRKRPTEA